MKRLVLLVAVLAAPRAWACASCGSGGDDPLILYPNELTKAYLGFTRTSGFRNVDKDGELSAAGGPEAKDALVIAAGRTLTPRAFVTATLPVLRNVKDGASKSAAGDPSVGGRYAFVLQSLAQPWRPQVQGVLSYKHAQARSLRESEEMKTLLDVFGTGFHEIRTGIDVWYGMTAVKAGVAHGATFYRATDFEGLRYAPGPSQRTTLATGYGWTSSAKTLIGANRERKDGLSVDGARLPDSDQLSHGVFVTQDLMVDPSSSVRLTLSRAAAFGVNKNTARSSGVTMAYARAF